MNISLSAKTIPHEDNVMDNIKFTQLAISEEVKPLTVAKEQHYKLTFSPEFPPIKTFQPTRYIYESLTEKTISVMGVHDYSGVFYQVGFVMPRNIKTGPHKIQKWGEGRVSAHVIADREVSDGISGEIEITRAEQSITASFNFDIDRNGTLYKIQNGKLFLMATGDL
jgi:hypothetical protein